MKKRILIFLFLFNINFYAYSGFSNPNNFEYFKIEDNGSKISLLENSPSIVLILKNLSDHDVYLKMTVVFDFSIEMGLEKSKKRFSYTMTYELNKHATRFIEMDQGNWIECDGKDDIEIFNFYQK